MSIDTSPAAVEALKPCPFCGTVCHNVVFPRLFRGEMAAIIECFTDGCYAIITASTPAAAIAAWNRRATPEAAPVQGRAILSASVSATDTAEPFAESISTSALEPAEAQGWQPISETPTPRQLHHACLSFNHSYGLMKESERSKLQWQATEWWRCVARAMQDAL